MKNRINLFIACIITVIFLICVTGCQDFLIQGTPGNTIININLDLSKLIKNARNDESQINGYVLKLFVYDAQNYKDGDREIENLPLITQTSNKVDVNGIVKASLEVEIDKTVIFVGKLFTLNEDNVESDKPLYAGKSEAFKVQPKDNKVHLVLSREKSEIGFEIELAETHTHTFAEEWSTSLSHHWKGTTCGHNDVMADFTEHSFSDWTTTLLPTEEVAGSKERTCEECNYKEVVEIANLAHTHTFADSWSTSLTHHWKGTTCGHNDVMAEFTEHSFSDWTTTQQPTEEVAGSKERTCEECNYKEVVEIANLAHTHTFADSWSTSLTHHWKGTTCGHNDVMAEFTEHSFGVWEITKEPTEEVAGSKERTCEECNYKEVVEIANLSHTHTFAEEWSTSLTHHWKGTTCGHNDVMAEFTEHSFSNWTTTKEPTEEDSGSKERTCSVCNYKEVVEIANLSHTHTFAEEWSTSLTHHWKGTTCGHNDVMAEFTEHSFSDWTTTLPPTEEVAGSKERTCEECNYKEVVEIANLAHTHTFADSWSTSLTHHWKGTTCGHNDVMAEFTEHSFSNWTTTKEPTEEDSGSKERTCSVCNYKEVVEIANLSHTHKFEEEWSASLTHHWKGTTCGHNDVMAEFTEHSFSNWKTTKEPTEEVAGSKERTCEECNYKEVVEIAKLAHTHKFATGWTHDAANHWKAATCEHREEVSEKAAHTFGDWEIKKEPTEQDSGSKERTCEECNYKEVVEIANLAHTHKFAEEWSASLTHHWKAATCIHTENVTQFGKHDFGEWTTTKEPTEEETGIRKQVCSDCYYEKIEEIEKNPAGFVYVKAGTFQMGSNDGNDDNKPVHQVTITKSFYMSKYEVTQAEYVKYCTYGGIDPSSSYGEGENYPAYYVTWYDTLVYCNKRSMEEGLSPCYSISGNTDPEEWGDVPTSSDTTWKDVVCDWNANGYRLPTEAEWEYAARAGDNTVSSLTWAGTNSESKLGEYAWYHDNSSDKTHPVGTNNANGFGLYDMSGNVYEWCWNWYTDSYEANSEGVSDPTGASSGNSRVFRGGCWKNDSGSSSVSYRNCFYPYYRNYFIGFRVVRSAN